MNMEIQRCTWTRKPRCRYCPERGQWDLRRDVTQLFGGAVEHVCDRHLAVALRNAGLTRLTIEQTATCVATVRP